jgi:1-acyl-sn-glycerol-3-phosphate acyltransferase
VSLALQFVNKKTCCLSAPAFGLMSGLNVRGSILLKFVRSALVFAYLVASLIPIASLLLLVSLVSRGDFIYWRLGVPYLNGVIQAARIIGGVKYRVQGQEILDELARSEQRVILCPKHQSTWETFFLPTIAPNPLSYVFKKELLWIPLFGWALYRLDMIYIDRSKRKEAWNRVAEQGRTLMDQGNWVIMFPEGTRTVPGVDPSYKTGASRLGVATDAVLVPIAITSGRCWPRASFALTPGIIDVAIGEPIACEGRDADELMKEVKAWVEAKMRELDPEPYQARA